MKKVFFIVCSVCVFFTSCDKGPSEPITAFVAGQIESIAVATDGADGFLLKLTNPSGEKYEAIIGDGSVHDNFEVGKKVVLKGDFINNQADIIYIPFMVKKIISTDNDNFSLNGVVRSTQNNSSGYNADIKGNDNELYDALFSISNLESSYTEYSGGQIVSVLGSLFVVDNELKITVKNIQS